MKPILKFRPFSLMDLDSVLKIERASFKTAYTRKRFCGIHQKHSQSFIVAELSKKIVGYIFAYLKDNSIYFSSIAVDKNYRNMGIGRKLFAFMFKHFAKKGLKKACLDVRTANKKAISFYENLGFKTVKKIKRYYRDGSDAYRMELANWPQAAEMSSPKRYL